jgi:hypothetical protein
MAAKTGAQIAKFESKQAKDKAKRPWPTKAVLAKQICVYTDHEGRRYYCAYDVGDQEYVRDHMESYDKKTHQALWCSLPPKVTSGGMPEEHDKYTFNRLGDKARVSVEVMEVSTVKYSRERGTGFVVIKLL